VSRSARTNLLVTGGAGFVGSALCRLLVGRGGYRVVNVDKLTYAGSLASLLDVEESPGYAFRRADICDERAMLDILEREEIHAIMHLAAETHVDRSIDGPAAFVETNVVGTARLLSAATAYWRRLDGDAKARFRFLHVSTDEVFGDLPLDGGTFAEESPYRPSSPYAASKAAADHFVRAWHRTYGLPVVLSTGSNTYGPFQHPEKLIPRAILNALEERPVPVYGTGVNVRDWLHVDDHACALEEVLAQGRIGQSYAVGARAERSNLAVVEAVCTIMDRKRPRPSGAGHRDLIAFVTDRPGHDRRYAIDPARIERELGWRAAEPFERGLEKTVDWYLANAWWWRPLRESP
jgi:dTDP-glucose 4,6-dehydratase